MASRTDIVVGVEGRADARGRPFLRADDPMLVRGDGVFETLLVRDGRVCLLDLHLARLARSAAIVGLPAPDPDRWRAAARAASRESTEPGDAVLRLMYGRRHGGVIGFAAVSAMPTRTLGARRDGVSAMTLDRGVTADGEVPWSVAGAKSLSYAVNAAALREAQRHGVGDVVLIGSDGSVLEGPRSSVVIADGNGALVTPPETSPILPGTTVHALFDVARAHGMVCARRPLVVSDLLAAQGVWLLSSITLAARIHTLDGQPLPVGPTAADVTGLVDEAVGGGR